MKQEFEDPKLEIVRFDGLTLVTLESGCEADDDDPCENYWGGWN